MEILLTRYHWLQLSNEQRLLMRTSFNIPKSGGVEMMGGKLMSDGSNENDLKVVSVETMQVFTGSTESSFESLYNLTILKIDAMIEEEKQKKIQEEENLKAKKRNEDINDVVASMIETFQNLSIDVQAKIRAIIVKEQKNIGEEMINNVIEHNQTNGNIKKAGRPKKVKEGSNIEGAESTGSGDSSTA